MQPLVRVGARLRVDRPEVEPVQVLATTNASDCRANIRRLRPLLELPVAAEKVEALTKEFRHRRLLPDEEVHDSLILAETVLLDCDILLTSDEHLRD